MAETARPKAPDALMTVGDFRRAFDGVPDDCEIETVGWGPRGAVIYRPIRIVQVGAPKSDGMPVLMALKIGERY